VWEKDVVDVLSEVVHRPVVASNLSSPAFSGVIEEMQATLMIDEADTVLRRNDELRRDFCAYPSPGRPREELKPEREASVPKNLRSAMSNDRAISAKFIVYMQKARSLFIFLASWRSLRDPLVVILGLVAALQR
jgi:hypothetical protein